MLYIEVGEVGLGSFKFEISHQYYEMSEKMMQKWIQRKVNSINSCCSYFYPKIQQYQPQEAGYWYYALLLLT